MSSPPESGKQRRRSPQVRFLFEENLPWRVASALRVLEYRASYVGQVEVKAPPRGASDEEVLNHARRTNQVVVTSHHDMILLCLEREQSVVWLDPYGRKITKNEMVVMVFREAPVWDGMLRGSTGPVCIRTLRTKTENVPKEQAFQMVRRRMKGLEAKRRRPPRAKPLGPLLEPASE